MRITYMVLQIELGAVAWQHESALRKGENFVLYGLLHLVECDALFFGQSDIVFEDGVATKQYALLLVVETHAAMGVARSGDASQRTIVLCGIKNQWVGGQWQRQRPMEYAVHVLLCIAIVVLLQWGNGGQDAKSVVEPLCAPQVVEVGVGDEQQCGLDIVVGNIVGDACLFGLAPHPTIYDYAHARSVVEHVGVFAQSVDYKSSYGAGVECKDMFCSSFHKDKFLVSEARIIVSGVCSSCVVVPRGVM